MSDPSPAPRRPEREHDEARYARFPEGFFDRYDEEPDEHFYGPPRIVTHIDDEAIAEVSLLYEELGVPDGEVLDLMSSWISHLPRRPPRLVALGMNAAELDSNEMAHSWVVADLNADPRLPFPDESFDTVTCCVSVDYLTSPLEVFDEVARVLRPGGRFVCTFSNRCFPSKAIRGWLASDDSGHVVLVVEYFHRSVRPEITGRLLPAWDEPVVQHRNADASGDPLYAVWATRRSDDADS